MIVPDLVHAFFAEVAKGLKSGLRQRGYQLVLASAEEEPELERDEIENLLARGVDAILVASCQSEPSGLERLVQAGIPFVLIDRVLSGFGTHFVGTDDVQAGFLATEHLLSLGRMRVAHIACEGISTGLDRLQGYKDALQAARIPFHPSLVVSHSKMEETGDRIGKTAMTDLLALKKRPDAVFCYNDLTAIGAIDCILDAGLRVPEDIAVIGCGNIPLAGYLRVPLSSVDQSAVELGEQAAKLTVSLLSAGSKTGLREIRVEPKVIARASTLGRASAAQ